MTAMVTRQRQALHSSILQSEESWSTLKQAKFTLERKGNLSAHEESPEGCRMPREVAPLAYFRLLKTWLQESQSHVV